MEQIQMATLTLKTIDLEINQTNHKGRTDQYQTSMTWNNINLRLLLGDMYDRYENFNLKLCHVLCDDNRLYNSGTGTYTNVSGDSNSDRIVTLNISGLNFLNNTYNTSTQCNSNSVVIATYEFYKEFTKEYNNSIVTFTKGNDQCNLTIEYKDVIELTPSTLNAYPEMVFVFHIYGIPKPDQSF